MSKKAKKTGYSDSLLNLSEQSSSSIWPEWSDGEINSEPWDHPKEFIDPRQIVLPPSLEAKEWKRFGKLDKVDVPIVFQTAPNYHDLITNNRHLMHSEFVRNFISTIKNLQYCGRYGLEIENPTSHLSWNLGDQPWQGWFNVYSLNRAGKGAAHRPILNPNGRYVVRLFHMGRWRRILVDDSIPIDINDRPLLPRTSNDNEIWPMILAKAMLKITGLSWTTEREILDCSLITCLTGWICLALNVSHLSPLDQWELLIKYTKRFERSDHENPSTNQDKSNETEKSTKSKKSKTKIPKLEIPEKSQPTYLFLSLDDSEKGDVEIIGVTPCWSHQVFVESSRDVPLDPTQAKAPLAKWKNHRWLDWAIRRGVIDAADYLVPLRRLLIVSPLAKSCKNTSFDNDDETEGEEKQSSETSSEPRKISTEKTRGRIINSLPKTKSEELENLDTSKWTDFNKLSYYLRQIHVYYRLKFFKHEIEICESLKNFLPEEANKYGSDSLGKEVKKSARKTTSLSGNDEKMYEYDDKKLASRNEPIYLFVDSVDTKFFLINYSTITLDESGPKKIPSFVIENYNFFERFVDDKTVGLIKTKGTKSIVFELEPGRHLLRIFINYELSYRAIIISDTHFDIGNRLKMHQLMITEAPRVELISQKIGTSMKKAFESFGTPNYCSDLKFFYQSYTPNSSDSKMSDRKFLKNIHNLFIEELCRLLKNCFSSIELPILQRALRIFFLDSTIGRINDSSIVEEENCNDREKSKANRSATIIQSFFRISLIKRYKKIHELQHPEHSHIKNTLLNISDILASEENEYGINYLLRQLIRRDAKLETVYSWAKDLKHVIEIQELYGRVTNLTSDYWVPIARVKINANKYEIVFGVIDLFTNLSNYAVRVFDDDTRTEMPFLVNNVTPNFYPYKNNGYTVFAYGSNESEKLKEIEWSLHLATMKGEPKFLSFDETKKFPLKIEPLAIRQMYNVYLPNSQNCIFKIIVKVRRNTLVSLRLKISYENALTNLRISKINGNVVADIEGGAILLLPLIYFDFDSTNEADLDSLEKLSRSRNSLSHENSGSSSQRTFNLSRRESSECDVFEKFTSYTIEAFVRKDSWPLDPSEWAVVMDFKSKEIMDVEKSRKSTTSEMKSQSMKNISKKSFDFGKLLKPYWIFQIITEIDDFEVIRDTWRENKIIEFKKKWNVEDPERAKRGQKLRQAFLDDNSLIIAPSAFDVKNLEDTIIEKKEASFDNLANEVSNLTERTLEPPANLANYLPKMDLSIYMEKEDEEEDRWIKSEFDEETLRNQRAINVLDFEQLQSSFLKNSVLLMKKQREKYQRTLKKYLENRDNRSRELHEAYRIRQNFVETTKSTARSSKSKDSSKPRKRH